MLSLILFSTLYARANLPSFDTIFYSELTLENQSLPAHDLRRRRFDADELEARVDRNAGVFLLSSFTGLDYRRAFVPPLTFVPYAEQENSKLITGRMHFRILSLADNLPEERKGALLKIHPARYFGLELLGSLDDDQTRGLPLHVFPASDLRFKADRSSRTLELRFSPEVEALLQADFVGWTSKSKPRLNLHVLDDQGRTRAIFRLSQGSVARWLGASAPKTMKKVADWCAGLLT